jgi:quercetin dioxygenase-like cupin family protein
MVGLKLIGAVIGRTLQVCDYLPVKQVNNLFNRPIPQVSCCEQGKLLVNASHTSRVAKLHSRRRNLLVRIDESMLKDRFRERRTNEIVVGPASNSTRGRHLKVLIFALSVLITYAAAVPRSASASPVEVKTLVKATSSWDGKLYNAYPAGQPEITVMKISIAPHTALEWHTHPMPSAAYVLSGDLTVEKRDGKKKHFVAGQAIADTVGSVHRGIAGSEPVVLIVFYAGTLGLPVSQ